MQLEACINLFVCRILGDSKTSLSSAWMQGEFVITCFRQRTRVPVDQNNLPYGGSLREFNVRDLLVCVCVCVCVCVSRLFCFGGEYAPRECARASL